MTEGRIDLVRQFHSRQLTPKEQQEKVERETGHDEGHTQNSISSHVQGDGKQDMQVLASAKSSPGEDSGTGPQKTGERPDREHAGRPAVRLFRILSPVWDRFMATWSDFAGRPVSTPSSAQVQEQGGTVVKKLSHEGEARKLNFRERMKKRVPALPMPWGI